MKRPAFQFYPEAWKSNMKLRRCSPAARGIWMDVLCAFHDSDEYGILRWPLAEIAGAIGAKIILLRELALKLVLKGGDGGCGPYVYTPIHAGRPGALVTLIDATEAPCWYSSRMVRDEYIRTIRGASTRFETEPDPPPNPLPNPTPKGGIGEAPKVTPKHAPKVGPKGGIGDGALALDSSSISKRTSGVTPTDSVRANGSHPAIENTGNSEAKTLSELWWKTPKGVAATAQTLGIERAQNEDDKAFKDRVYSAVEERNRQAQLDAVRRGRH